MKDKNEIRKIFEHLGHPKTARGSAPNSIWQFVSKINKGDVIVANNGESSLVGIGIVKSDYLPPKDPKNPNREEQYHTHVRLVDWKVVTVTPVKLRKKFFHQNTVLRLDAEHCEEIHRACRKKLPAQCEVLEQMFGELDPNRLPEEVSERSSHWEGAVQKIIVNRYERSHDAKIECVSHYGSKCGICKFDFGDSWGDFMEGYIHVHHLKPIHKIGKRYKIDPIKDLIPLCPNCHAVVHHKGAPSKIDVLRKRFDTRKNSK